MLCPVFARMLTTGSGFSFPAHTHTHTHTHTYIYIMKIQIQWLTFLLRTWVISGSNHGTNTEYPEVFRVFLSLQKSAGIVPKITSQLFLPQGVPFPFTEDLVFSSLKFVSRYVYVLACAQSITVEFPVVTFRYLVQHTILIFNRKQTVLPSS
jgi:hypothetical protein